MRPTRSHVLVLGTAVCMSFILIHSYALKTSGMSSLQQVLLRMAIATPLLALLLGRKGTLRGLGRSDLRLLLSIGLVFSLFLFSALSAIALGLPIAVAVALVYTQPIFTAIFSALGRKEPLGLGEACIILLGTGGAILSTGLSPEELLHLKLGIGLVFGFLSGFLYALYLALKRQLRERGYTPEQITISTFATGLTITAILSAALLLTIEGDPRLIGFTLPSAYQMALAASFAIFSTAMPYTLLNYVRPEDISPASEGLLLLLDPALHVLWAYIIFGQAVGPWQYMGVALIIMASAIFHLRRRVQNAPGGAARI